MSPPVKPSAPKNVRVWCDGCFDMAHYGHANQLRQAKLLGDHLVAGVHCDEEIRANKGPPVFTEEERYRLVGAIKWVDEVVENAPLQTRLATLDEQSCDFCVHGDDLSLFADGTDTFAEVKRARRYREVRRTPDISTTALVGRMILCSRDHHTRQAQEEEEMTPDEDEDLLPNMLPRPSPFISDLIKLFSDHKSPIPGQEVVYVSGAFDFFHVGHLSFLEKVWKPNRFVIVGVELDASVNARKGQNFPIMTLYERALGVMACKYVSETILGAPYTLTAEFLDARGISQVFHGADSACADPASGGDPHAVARERGIFSVLDSGSSLTTERVFQRIIDRRTCESNESA